MLNTAQLQVSSNTLYSLDFFSEKQTGNNAYFPLKYRCFRVSCMFFPWTNPMSEWYGFVWNRVSHFFHCLIIIIPSWSLFNGHIDWWVTPPSIPFLYTLYICQFVNCIPPIFGGLKSYLIEPHKWPSTGVPEYDGGVWSPKKTQIRLISDMFDNIFGSDPVIVWREHLIF